MQKENNKKWIKIIKRLVKKVDKLEEKLGYITIGYERYKEQKTK